MSGSENIRTQTTQDLLDHLQAVGRENDRIAQRAQGILDRLAAPGLYTEFFVEDISRDEAGNTDQQVFATVLAALQNTRDGSGRKLYRVKDDIRRYIVRRLGIGALSKPLDGSELDAFERLLLEAAVGHRIDAADVETYGTEYTLRVVAILSSPSQPSEHRLLSLHRRNRRIKAMSEIRQAVFVGRDDQVRLLEAQLTDRLPSAQQIIEVQGPAGVGKTTFVRHVIADICTDPRDIVIEVDFERPVTNENIVSFIGREIAFSLFDTDHISERRFQYLISQLDQARDADVMVGLILQNIYDLEALSNTPVVFFLDSVELFVSAFGDQSPIMDVIEALISRLRFCRTVLCTRLSGFQYHGEAVKMELRDLRESDITELCYGYGLNPVMSRYVVRSLPERNPLLAVLLIAAVKTEHTMSLEAALRPSHLSNVLFQRFVVERIISKLPDPAIREIARAAIPLRRITEGMLFDSDVFGTIKTFYDLRPGAVFERLRKQILFFEGNGELRLRSDIRGILLRLGSGSENNASFQATRQKAFKYFNRLWNETRDSSAGEDALYYALCLGFDRHILERLWSRSYGSDLIRHLSDMPNRSKAWLKSKARRRWTILDFREGFVEDVERETIGYANAALAAGRFEEVRSLAIVTSQKAPFAASLCNSVIYLTQVHVDVALDRLITTINQCVTQDTKVLILPTLIRTAALAGFPNSQVAEIVEPSIEWLKRDRTTNRWMVAYFELWAARLTSRKGDSARATTSLQAELANGTGRFNARVELESVEAAEFSLLASLHEPIFAIAWINSLNTRSVPVAILECIDLFLRDNEHAYEMSVKDRRGVIQLLSAGAESGKSALRSSVSSRLISFRRTFRPHRQINVSMVRTAMSIQASSTIVGLLIATLLGRYPGTNSSDLDIIGELVGRNVSAEGRTETLVAAAVRRILISGGLFDVIARLGREQGPDVSRFKAAVDNWLRCLEIDSTLTLSNQL